MCVCHGPALYHSPLLCPRTLTSIQGGYLDKNMLSLSISATSLQTMYPSRGPICLPNLFGPAIWEVVIIQRETCQPLPKLQAAEVMSQIARYCKATRAPKKNAQHISKIETIEQSEWALCLL